MKNQLQKTEDTILWVSTISQSKDKSLSIIEFERSLDFKTLIHKQPILNDVKNELISEIQCIAFIRELLLNLASTLKFSENLTLQQATILASDVFDKMKYETLDDIALMFKKARQGYYGSLKGRLDSDILNTIIIPSYLNEKSEIRELHQKDIKASLIENKTDSEALNYNLEMLERMSKQILKEKRQKKLDEYNNSLKNDKVDFFIEKAKLNCKKMTIDELKNEIQKAELNLLTEFVEIYQIELNNRK